MNLKLYISNSLNKYPYISYNLRYFLQPLIGAEKKEFTFLKKLCKNNNFIGIDFGANNGVYTKLFQKYSEHCFSIEPNPTKIKYLNKNNKRYKNIEIIDKAIWNKNSIAHLNTPLVDNQLIDGQARVDDESNTEISLKIKTMNFSSFVTNYLKSYLDRKKLFIIKCDVEGSEKYIINKSNKFFKEERIIILIEWNKINQKQNQKIFELLTSYNYKIIHPNTTEFNKLNEDNLLNSFNVIYSNLK